MRSCVVGAGRAACFISSKRPRTRADVVEIHIGQKAFQRFAEGADDGWALDMVG